MKPFARTQVAERLVPRLRPRWPRCAWNPAAADERLRMLGLFDFIKDEGAASRMVQALQQENYEAFPRLQPA